jgi:hypothetical protein
MFLVFWCGSLIKCEYLTSNYGKEFENLWEQAAVLQEPEFLKVLKYTDHSASVYYVSPNRQGGTVLYFIRSENCWVLDGWGPYWAYMGSADDLVWPYIR